MNRANDAAAAVIAAGADAKAEVAGLSSSAGEAVTFAAAVTFASDGYGSSSSGGAEEKDLTDEEVEAMLKGLEKDEALYGDAADGKETKPLRFLAVLSLAEGETLRRAMHTEANQAVMAKAGVGLALRTLDGGFTLDESSKFRGLRAGSGGDEAVGAALQCLRFVNCDMYYTDEELELLLLGVRHAPIPDRAAFFAACIALAAACLAGENRPSATGVTRGDGAGFGSKHATQVVSSIWAI